MPRSVGRSVVCATLALALAIACAPPVRAAGSTDEKLARRIDQLEKEIQELRALLAERKKPADDGARRAAIEPPAGASAPSATAVSVATPPAGGTAATVGAPAEAARSVAAAEGAGAQPRPSDDGAQAQAGGSSLQAVAREVADRVKMGGYGSGRFEVSSPGDLNDTFTLRRLVLTADARIAPRLRSMVEVEFERFRKLELEKTLAPADGGLESELAVEGTDGSEIALEQAWLEFEATSALRLRAGAVLVPVGRFNINHDDNRWDIPRRPLLDRGVPVLPATAAWDEVGAGLTGNFELGRSGLLDYQLYVMNGAVLDPTVEQVVESRVGDTTLSKIEVVVSPETGTFAFDTKDAKALAGRLDWSPTLGSDLAGSFYWGRYTPDYLPSEHVYTLALDGATALGPVQMQGEFAFTHFGGIRNVAEGLARQAIDQEAELESGSAEYEIEFELANMASNKYGYWLELRYPFFPEFLRDTFLGRPFDDPQLAVTFRPEQVWFEGLVDEVDFSDSELTEFSTQSRLLNRFTLALSYRPTPLVVFSLAYEYTRTNSGKSLASVTNYLPTDDDQAGTFMAGAAFGF